MKIWLLRSLNLKLSILLLLSVMVPLISLGVYSYLVASDVTQKNTEQSGMNILDKLQTNLDFIVNDVSNMSIFLVGQRNIQQYIAAGETNITLQSDLVGFLSGLVYSKPYLSSIIIKPDNPNLPPLSSAAIVKSHIPNIQQINPFYFDHNAKWWSPVYELDTTSGKSEVISLVRPARSIGRFLRIGMLTVSVKQDYINRMLQRSMIADGGTVLLLDDKGRVLAGGDADDLMRPIDALYPGIRIAPHGKGIMEYRNGKINRTVLYQDIPDVAWRIVAFIPAQVYKSQNRYVLRLTAIAVAIAMVLIVILVLSMVHWVTRPLQKISQFLKNAKPGEPIPAYTHSSIDEVGQLVNSYNKLTKRVESLTEQVKRKEALKKETDMRALQSQINPHFLYNTLSSVHWMALMNQDLKTADMVGSLSDFLRFSLNKGMEYCTVEQEIAHVKHYANIQSIRYPDKFKVDFYIDEDMNKRMMLKLLLQPLIENALTHGILKKAEGGTINVQGVIEEGRLKFSVEDDGVGIPLDKLNDLRRQLREPAVQNESSNGYGLRNVHNRLVLHYGEASGLTMTSKLGKGTTISFSIPNLEEMPDENHDRG